MDKDLYIEFLETQLKKQRQEIVQQDGVTRPRKKRHKKHLWTAAEKLRLLQLHESGYEVSQIANMMNHRPNQVTNMIYSIKNREQVSSWFGYKH